MYAIIEKQILNRLTLFKTWRKITAWQSQPQSGKPLLEVNGVESRNIYHKEIENEDNISEIPSEIYSKLRNALLNCEQFDSVERLRNFFKVNASLTPWQGRWQAGSPLEMVEDAIGYLHDKFRSDTKENALVILVRLLAESINPADSRYQTLVELAQELNVVLSRNVT